MQKTKTIAMAAGLSLSDLPAEIIIAILSKLPIADAVRTSILSRYWRHQWRSIPDFIFKLHNDRDIAAVNHVLGLHTAPIQSFSLSVVDCQLVRRSLHRWLAALSTDPLPLRSLTVDMWGPLISAYPLLLSFSNLNHLRLCGCALPRYYYGLVGFPVLETLHLSSCSLPDFDSSSSISNLISNCPLLQKLTLLYMECRHLRICAPNLHSLVFKGKVENFALASAPLLTTAEIRLHEFDGDDEKEELNECNLIKAFGDVRSIEKLNLLHCSLHFLGKFGIPDRIPDSFERLKVLTLTVDFSFAKETLVLLCLLRSAPNLHEIKIEGLQDGREIWGRGVWGLGHDFWQAQKHLELPKLQTLKLTRITCVEPMLEFIDYILPKARELKEMNINISPASEKYGSIGKLSSSKELVLHWRASTRAKIIFTGEFLSECTITSSGSDAASPVWISSASRGEFNELRHHIESKLQGLEDRVQKMESEIWDPVKELHCQILFLLLAIPPVQRFGAAYGGLVSGASDPSTAGSINNNGVGADR